MIIAHNLMAMNTQRQFGINAKSKSKSVEKLSSGYKINRAADDAAGLAISEKMRRMIRGLDQGAENTQDGISFVQIGDGAMEEIHDMVHRMTELSVKASNGTLSPEDREYINQEVQALKTEINRVAHSTTFNEIPIFDNTSVSFGLEGTPNDLQIFNATYDATGGLVTYGGFLFHGERITWDMISQDMVTTDATTGTQRFNGGDYSYTSPQTGYSFEFSCEDGEVPPIITREISIAADSSGIYLGKEHFDWSKVYDLNGNTCSASNLHVGPWAVDYYGSKFVFTVSDPVADLTGLADDVNSCKNSSVYYNWEVYYSEGADEKAVDVLHTTVKVRPGNDVWRVTQDTAYSMARDVVAEKSSGIHITVRAGEDGIWLEDLQQNTVAGSLVTWEDMGIQSWEEGMEVPGLSNGSEKTYTYEDPSGKIGLFFQFELSDITSKDSVIDGLDGMKVSGWPGSVDYEATANLNTVSGSDVLSVTCTDSNLFLGFYEERAEQRNFDEEYWETTSNVGSYANGKITINFSGGFSLSGSTTPAEYDIKQMMASYASYVLWQKRDDVVDGPASTKTDTELYEAFAQTHSTIGSLDLNLMETKYRRSAELTYQYDYADILKDFTDKVNVEMARTTVAATPSDIAYVLQDDGSYLKYQEHLDNLYAQIDNDDVTYPTTDDKTAAKKQAEQDLQASGKIYTALAAYKNKSGNTVSSMSDAISSYYSQVLKDLAGSTTVTLESQEYSRVAVGGDEKTNAASRPAYVAVMKETPTKPDIYIVHSSVEGDMTGIPRFAMNATALGIAFADCATEESARQLIANSRNALNYVSSKRACYGALQNRLEHTYNNNRNISENMSVAESRIRDTDMAKETVKHSRESILEQVGQAMMAQANQSNQGVLNLLN